MAWIGGNLLLVKALYDVQRLVGTEAELLVAVNLQRGQVIEAGWCLKALLLGNRKNGERLVLDSLQHILAFLLGSIFHLTVDGTFALQGLALLGSFGNLCSLLSFGLLVAHDGAELDIPI